MQPIFSAVGTVLPWALANVEGVEILLAAEATHLQTVQCWRKAKDFDQGVKETWWSKDLNLLSTGSPTHWDILLCLADPCQLEKDGGEQRLPLFIKKMLDSATDVHSLVVPQFPSSCQAQEDVFPLLQPSALGWGTSRGSVRGISHQTTQ